MSAPLAEPSFGQLQVLRFIQRERRARGVSPSIREIADHFGWSSTNSVADFLKALERKGLLRREPLRARTLQPTARGLQVLHQREGA